MDAIAIGAFIALAVSPVVLGALARLWRPPGERVATWYWRWWWFYGYRCGFYRLNWWWKDVHGSR